MAVQVPKWGETGASLGWRAEVFRRMMGIPLILILLAFFGSDTYWDVLFGLGALLAVADFVGFVIASRRSYRAAAQRLGVSVGWRSAPPSSAKDYEEWCMRQGIRPYDAG
jgi:hypothetical protein